MTECCQQPCAQQPVAEVQQVQGSYHLPTILENLEKDLAGKNSLIESLTNDIPIIQNLINKIKELI